MDVLGGLASEDTLEATHVEALAVAAVEALAEVMPEAAMEALAEAVLEALLEAMLEALLEAMPEDVVEALPEAVVEAIPEDVAIKEDAVDTVLLTTEMEATTLVVEALVDVDTQVAAEAMDVEEVVVEDIAHQIVTKTTTTHTTVKTTNAAVQTNVSDHRFVKVSNKLVMFKTVTSATRTLKLLSLLNVALSGKTMHALEGMSVKIFQRSESMQLKTLQM